MLVNESLIRKLIIESIRNNSKNLLNEEKRKVYDTLDYSGGKAYPTVAGFFGKFTVIIASDKDKGNLDSKDVIKVDHKDDPS